MADDLHAQVQAKFVDVNGVHPMTAADDAYVDEYYVPLEQIAADSDWLRTEMLAGRLPLPSYVRSDGVQMVPADLLALAERAGGTGRLRAWFLGQWPDPESGAEEWQSYLSGQYVCLRSVTPETIQRKAELIMDIGKAIASAQPESVAWLTGLHALVDELDALEPPFTGYDRLRFGGPVSRDSYIDKVRTNYPLG
ncbi:DUF6058 family natural product biosynthesis protein [Actinocrispum sp. NPDC049592]|uniref:DUF6058 family natural product biosynthesis protein n=1 Tax=Actinocrispum sp. NPDC049592 TaxID=3154835 RepID=UPI0034287633